MSIHNSTDLAEAIKKANAFYERKEIVKARQAFDQIIIDLETDAIALKTQADKKLFAQAYTGCGLAYMTGSAVHGMQALEAFKKAIALDPNYDVPKQKKAELEFELGLTQNNNVVSNQPT